MRCITASSRARTRSRIASWRFIWHPNGSQPVGTMLNGQLVRIPSVGSDPLARLLGNQRRRSNRTTVTELDQLSVDAVVTTAGFVAEL
jgi:hypothetical protein